MHVENAPGNTPIPTNKLAIPDVADIQSEVINIYSMPISTPSVSLNAETIAVQGNGGGHNNMQPFLVLNYCIAISGVYPPRPYNDNHLKINIMDAYIVNYVLFFFPGNYAPEGWHICDGAQLTIQGNEVFLFSLIGTTLVVNGIKTKFGLPDLRGRMAISSRKHGTPRALTLPVPWASLA
jgi:microcystin-dependent protein